MARHHENKFRSRLSLMNLETRATPAGLGNYLNSGLDDPTALISVTPPAQVVVAPHAVRVEEMRGDKKNEGVDALYATRPTRLRVAATPETAPPAARISLPPLRLSIAAPVAVIGT